MRKPKAILEIRKKTTFLYVINYPIIYKFFKDFSNYRKKTDRAAVFSCRDFPVDSFIHFLKSSASTYESSGSQFFRTTTGKQSGPDTLHESRFVMTFLTILQVTETLCTFRLVVEGKTGKEIPDSSRLVF